jgi:hypothetical protein
MKDELKERHTCCIKGGLQFTGIHEKVAMWIKNVPGAHFIITGGAYINGIKYYSNIEFDTEEDLLAFSLIFAGNVFPIHN